MKHPFRGNRFDLDDLLAELCTDARAPLFEIDPTHLARALSGAFARWEARAELRRATAELEAVHRLELAGLLRSAARLRAAGEPCGALFPYEPPSAPTPRVFAECAVETLEALRLDGLVLPGAARLAELLRTDPARWPGAVELARAALALDGGAAGQLALGEALLAAGEPAEAARVFGALAREGPLPGPQGAEARWRALAGLACAHEGRGSDFLALGACEAAAAEPGCGPGTLVARLFLALAVEDLRRVRRAADDLDRAPPPAAGVLGSALGRLRIRVELGRGGLPWRGPRAAAAWLVERAGTGRGGCPAGGESAPEAIPRPDAIPSREVARALA